MQTPGQLLEMDEMTFHSRPEKARKKKTVYKCDCPVTLVFKEQMDSNHISLLAMITLSGETLKPMLLQIPSRTSQI
jgi:hypothetical protein